MAKNLWTKEEIEQFEELYKNGISYDEISKILNRTNGALTEKCKQLGLSEKYMRSNNPNFKVIYQDYDWCYDMYVNKGLNHDEMSLEAKCSKRVIEKWCSERHRLTQKFRQKNKQLNDIQRDLIIGSLLGDGHIDKRETQPMFIVSHAENQKDYLFWKYEILKDLCNIKPVYKKSNIRYFDNKPYVCQPSYRFCTRIYDCLKLLRQMNKTELIFNLNEFSLSIFILDDGNRDRSNWVICVAGFNKEDKDFFIKTLKDKFSINSYLSTSDDRYVKLRAESSRLMDNIILRNLPNELDILKSKILENKISKAQKKLYILIHGEYILFKQYCKDNNLDYKAEWAKNKDSLKAV